MPLTVRLDSDTEHYLNDLLDETGQDKSSLIRQLIRERWQQAAPAPTKAPSGAKLMQRILIYTGLLLSYYQQQEPLHQAVIAFFDQNTALAAW